MKKSEGMTIRQETPADYAEVCELVKLSFAVNADDDGTTHDYLNKLRTKDTFIPELSLVAEADGGTLIGQIVLYKTAVTTDSGELTELLLSPICVRPDWFRRGVARAMTEEALRIAAEMGFRAVFLCGDPAVYRRLGFMPAKQYDIFHVNDKDAEWSMVRELYDGALDGITGTVDTV
jgi:predicted N-acetyltransferase YhbS